MKVGTNMQYSTGFTELIAAFMSLQVKNWVKELRKMLGNEICLCIVGE